MMQQECRMNVPKEDLKCVYCIENRRNGKKYIGSSAQVRNRIRMHLAALIKSSHNSLLMQNDFDSGDNFTVRILKEFPRTVNGTKDMLAYERDMIIFFNTLEHGYNRKAPSEHQPYIYSPPSWSFDMQNIEKLLCPFTGPMTVQRRSAILKLCKILECSPDDIMSYNGNLKYSSDLRMIEEKRT